jgi:peptidyl-prolyl cis-trans isomerase SurA
MPDTPQNRERISSQVLRSLIDEKLQLQEAKRLGVTVSQDEINQAFARIEQQNNMQKGALDQLLTQANIPRTTLTDQITAALGWNKLVRNRLMQDVTISDEEVNDALARLKENADVPQSHVAEIFLAVDSPQQDPEVKAVADRLIEQIRGGVRFAAVAQQFSQSPTAAVGGDLGWVTPQELPTEVGQALAKMKPGEMSYPLRAASGYYLIYLLEQRTATPPNAGDTLLSLVEVTLPLSPDAGAEAQQRVIAQAQQISESAKSCGELAKLGRENAPQTSREISETKAAELPTPLRDAALRLGVAEASKPLPMPGAVGVIMVCSRKDPASKLPTRDQVMDLLGRERLDTLARRYLRDLRRSAYVDIRG